MITRQPHNISIFFYITLALVISSCSPKIIPITETKTEYINTHQRDSIYFRDSIYLTQIKDKDTIRIYEYHHTYHYQNISGTDTVIKSDSIPYPVRVEVEKILYKRKLADTLFLYLLIPALIILLLLTKFKII
jgi:hypothetical protein